MDSISRHKHLYQLIGLEEPPRTRTLVAIHHGKLPFPFSRFSRILRASVSMVLGSSAVFLICECLKTHSFLVVGIETLLPQ